MKYSKFIVALVILLNTIFTAAVLYIFLRVETEPTTLITAWFAFTTGELWLLAGIKKHETRFGEKEGDEKNDSKDNRDKPSI
ncbi:hypothetical protein [Caldanaerobacter subterraneus]|uniref:Uncharacterized protein n=1 Tax=Caldanaerobacter subterraneus TaxID=911092 RepID=A0A7Y2PN54_9THEO|nr:hypothetical protein [Caldanaerobacter subterraneus]NNG67361.1 hypothetical protein [Caldanaerobacter subterraneus]